MELVLKLVPENLHEQLYKELQAKFADKKKAADEAEALQDNTPSEMTQEYLTSNKKK